MDVKKIERVECNNIIWRKDTWVMIDLAIYKKILCEEILDYICTKRCDKSSDCTKRELFIEMVKENEK